MKKLIYASIIVFLASALYACSSNDEAPNMTMNLRDISDLRIFIGSPSGAKEINIATAYRETPVSNLDSLRLVLARKYFATPLASVSDSCSKITYEFLSDKLIYINNYTASSGITAKYQQIISSYKFRNDSLFTNLSDGSEVYLGLGENSKKLYANIGFVMCPIGAAEDKSVTYFNTDTVNIDRAIQLSYIANKSDMTNEKDTIAVCNVKYIYN